MNRRRREIGREIRVALSDSMLKQALTAAMAQMRERRRRVMPPDDQFQELRERARAIKEEALNRGDALIDEFERRAAEAGAVVVRAADGKEACTYITELARQKGVSLITKSKSMTAEEIHLSHALEAAGIEVIEGDLGERIIQLAGERPSHLVVPAIHHTKQEVIALLSAKMGISNPPSGAERLTRLVRQDLRHKFLGAQMGVTGSNFAIAETGTIVLVENEGNASLTSQLPPVHVALVGREKVIPRLDDLGVFLELLPRSATGQKMTSYVSLITGRQAAPLPGVPGQRGGREFHLVILDNGRSAAAADPELSEALLCIRCGACLNACAPYTQVGGHVYGADPYPGGIGCAWTYITGGATGHADAADFNGLCTTCARCTEVCPVKIDIPWLNTCIKARDNAEFGAGLRQRLFARVDLMAKVFSLGSPVSNLALRTPPAKWSFRLLGIDPERSMPDYERHTFLDWWGRREVASSTPAGPRVALFVDCFMNHNLPAVGRAAVEVLEHAGFDVRIAHNRCCGRPALSQGMLDKPRQWAVENLEESARLIDQGYDIVCIEPSCLSAMRDDYEPLLRGTSPVGDPRLGTVRDHTFDITEYLVSMARSGRLPLRLAHPGSVTAEQDAGTPSVFVVHGHCHQKALGIGSAPAELLRLIPGASVVEVDALCCGMVGSFGYKEEFSPLSIAIGGELFESLLGHDGQIVTCGISCRSQIEMGTGREVIHPVEALAARLSSS
jgi:iron-sulfur cluster protein